MVALALASAVTARLCWALACASCASSTLVCIRASGCPRVTKSPSLTMTSSIRPASLVAMLTSVASSRPLPETSRPLPFFPASLYFL